LIALLITSLYIDENTPKMQKKPSLVEDFL